jgi:two-component system response regulator MprA
LRQTGTRIDTRQIVTSPAGNVLIVEDDRDVREMLCYFLSTEGFHIVAAEDGLEALHLLRTMRRRAPAEPCLVLLDLRMPRLGGQEFRRAQLEDPTVADVPVAVITGATDGHQHAEALGAVALVHKPIDVTLLLDVVRTALGATPGRSATDPPATGW